MAEVNVSGDHYHTACKSYASVAPWNTRLASPATKWLHGNTIKSEIAEAIDQEWRKCNVIIDNMTDDGSDHVTRVESLLEYITGD